MDVKEIYIPKLPFPSVGNIEVSIILQSFFQFLNAIKYIILLRLVINILFENYPQNRQTGIYQRIKLATKTFNTKNNNKQNVIVSRCNEITNTKNNNWAISTIMFCENVIVLFFTKSINHLLYNIKYNLKNETIISKYKMLLTTLIKDIEIIKHFILNCISCCFAIFSFHCSFIIILVLLKIKQPRNRYNNNLFKFIILLLSLNYQVPPLNTTLNTNDYDISNIYNSSNQNIFPSSIDEINFLTNTWINRFKQYNPFSIISLINIPMANAQEINNEIQNKDANANVIYNTFSKKDITLSIESQCLERNKIFLSEQEEQIQFEIILSNPPSASINITFINDKPDLFTIEPENIIYKSAYYSVTTKNNSIINLMENDYNLTQYFTVKTFNNSGSSNLKINVDTELNKVYEYKNKIVEENNNSSLGRLIIDKSVSEPLEMKATSSNVGTMNTFLILWIVLFMFSLGLSFSGNTLKGLYKWKRLKPFICGYVCQLIINPLVAFILTKIFKLSDYISLGVIIVAASPGSFIAPVFTYYLGGDRALAVGLCLVATIFGSFTFPLTIWLFCIVLQIKIETYIPFWETFSLTATQIIPLGIGSLILHFKPHWASKLTKFCPIWAVAIILTSIITSVKNYGQIFINSWQAYSMPIILGIISYIIGFVVPRVFGMNNQQVRAICFNTGLQNSPLALTVIQVLGMPSCGQLMSLVPLHHSLWTLVEGVVIAIAMFFLFPTDVKAIEENSEYPLTTNKNSEEKKSILQDDQSENYSNNNSMTDVSVLDISDVNLHKRLISDTEVLNNNRKPSTPISNYTNYNRSVSPVNSSPTNSNNNNRGNSPVININGSTTINLYRNGSLNSQNTKSTILPNSLKDNNSIRRNSNVSNITDLSKNNKLSPIFITTPVHQRKPSNTSTIKFNNNYVSPTNIKKSPTSPTSPTNSNVDSDLGLEIFDIPLDGSDDEDIDFTHRQNEKPYPKDPKGQIPSIVIQSMNSSKSTSPILAYSPYQNKNSSPNRNSPHTPLSNASFAMPTTNIDKNSVHSRRNSPINNESTPKYENENNDNRRPSREGFLNPSLEKNIVDIESDMDNQKLKKKNSNESINETRMVKSNSNIKDIINNKFHQRHPRASLSHHPPIILSQVVNKYLPAVFKKSSPDTSNSPSPNSSTPTSYSSYSSSPNSSIPNLINLTPSPTSTKPNSINNSSNSNDQNSHAYLNADADNTSINFNPMPNNNDPRKLFNSTMQSQQDQINPKNQLNSKELSNTIIDIDTQPIKLFNSINSSNQSVHTDNTNQTNLTNRSSLKSLKSHRNKICRTDTIQTFETANSNHFNSIVFGDDSIKEIDLEESDGEDIDIDDEIFKDCSLKELEDFSDFN